VNAYCYYITYTHQQVAPSERSERGHMVLGYMLGYMEFEVLKTLYRIIAYLRILVNSLDYGPGGSGFDC